MAYGVDHVEGSDRRQTILLPDMLDEYVSEDNPVRFIDAFVDKLDMKELGFKHSVPSRTGRPSYNPADLLKLFIYGYLNQIRSSRKLERECNRNLELAWLMKRLTPDFKTIADFRKDNINCVKKVFKEFVFLCKSLDLFGAELVAIDGSKFKAVNSKSRNFNEAKLQDKLRRIDEKVSSYMKEMNENDQQDEESKGGVPESKKNNLKEKLLELERRKSEYSELLRKMKESGQEEVSLTDPNSRLMKSASNGRLEVGYNVLTDVDSKNKMIVDYEVTNVSSDREELSRMAKSAKEILEVEKLDVTADSGFHNAEEIKECVDNGITPYVPEPNQHGQRKIGVPAPDFYENKFVYDNERDMFVCPAGNKMSFWSWGKDHSGKTIRIYTTPMCNNGCPFRSRCTNNKLGRHISRWVHENVLDEMNQRLKTSAGHAKVLLRKELSEHPFGTMKRAFNQGYLLLKGLRKAKGEIGFTMLVFNIRRAINILGVSSLIAAVRLS